VLFKTFVNRVWISFASVNHGRDFLVIKLYLIDTVTSLHPVTSLAQVLLDFVFSKGVVNGRFEFVGRCELQGQLSVITSALGVGEFVTQVIDARIHLTFIWRVNYFNIRVVPASSWCVRGIPLIDTPVVNCRTYSTRVTLLVAHTQGHTKSRVVVCPAEQA